jgi:hypothetical protein
MKGMRNENSEECYILANPFCLAHRPRAAEASAEAQALA